MPSDSYEWKGRMGGRDREKKKEGGEESEGVTVVDM